MFNINVNDYAAIVFHVVENCSDWEQIYLIAKGPKSLNKVTEDSKSTLIYRWKNKPEIKKAIQEIKRQYETKIENFKMSVLSGVENEPKNRATKNESIEKTNFLDRDEFLQFLNDRANQITDDKLRNDILKMLSDNLRYKDTERDENNEIQRFYTPITCENCAIYQKCKGCKLSGCPAML